MVQPADLHRNTADSSPPLTTVAQPDLSFGILQISYPDGRQEIADLIRATIHVGRAEDNDVILDHELIADHHAQILCDYTGCQVLDLGSHIGSQILERGTPEQRTLVGKRLPPKAPHPLEKGTTVLMGEVILIYYPSVNEIPKTVRSQRLDRLVRFLNLVAAILLVGFILGGSAVWFQSWWLSSRSLASAAPSPRPTAQAIVAQVTPSPVVVTPTQAIYSFTVDTDYQMNLHIRSAPGLDQPILGKIPFGTSVQVYGQPVRHGPYHWVRVDAPNLSGWCILDALRTQ